jgi:hypothetical protein
MSDLQTTAGFARSIQAAVQKTVINKLAQGDWLNIDYGNRVKVPMSQLQECYDRIDMNRVMDKLVDRLEDKLADKIFNNLATEIGTDVKSIMSNPELRETCRGILRGHMKSAVKNIRESE